MRKFGEKKTPEFLLAHIEKLNASCPGLGSFSPCDRKQEPGIRFCGHCTSACLSPFPHSLKSPLPLDRGKCSQEDVPDHPPQPFAPFSTPR